MTIANRLLLSGKQAVALATCAAGIVLSTGWPLLNERDASSVQHA
jgi:hypothetical protein